MSSSAVERPTEDDEARFHDRRARLAVGVIAGVIIVGLVAGLALLANITQARIDRAERSWLQRLDIIVEGRRSAVADWLRAQRASLGGLADNDTVRLFITQLADAGYDLSALGQGQAQQTYVANLLKATAQRDGFSGELLGADIAANVDSQAAGGLSLVRPDGKPIVTTRAAAPPDLPNDAGAATGPRFLGRVSDPEDAFAIGFYAPVFGIQDDPTSDDALAYVIGYRRAGDELRDRLQTDVALAESLRTLLITAEAGRVRPILTAQPGSDFPRVSVSDKGQALAFAWATPGGAARKQGSNGEPVLVSARDLPHMPWGITTLVARDDAIGTEITRARRTALGFSLAGLAVGLAMLALWRHGASVRARAATARYRETAQRLDTQRRLLSTITDNQPTIIVICDDTDTVRFANARAGESTDTDPANLAGKSLSAVFGPAVASSLRVLNATARQSNQIQTKRLADADGFAGVWLSSHVPLPPDTGWDASVLIVQHDVSAEVVERERRERTLNGLVEAMMTIVDQRDQRTGRRSRMLAKVAATLAKEAGATAREQEAARLAGILMNLGKVLVPEDVLERAGPLSVDEKAQIRASTFAVARLVSELEFDAPVHETLQQVHERVDGCGEPLGLSRTEILLPARTVAIANTFVGMITDRPDRAALSTATALEHLWADADSSLDRGLVGALANLIENRGLTQTLADT